MSQYVTVNEVADHFNVSTSSVRIWLTEGKLPRNGFIKVGRTYRFKIDVIEQHLLSMDLDSDDTTEEDADAPTQIEMDFGDDTDGDEDTEETNAA